MRKLVALVIAGSAMVAIVIYLAHPRSDNVSPAAGSAERHASLASDDDHTTKAADTHDDPVATARDKSYRATALDPPPATAIEDPSRATVPLTAEQQANAACIALSERRAAGEKAALHAEPKDPAWAYPMEQKLREYLTQKLQSGEVEVIGIECRTSFCEIKALLVAPEGSPEFNNALSDATGKSWNDFTGMGTSLSRESGKTFYAGQLMRRQFKMPSGQTAEEAQAEAACFARSMEKQDRAREARDAQPKDPSWAGPMEQLLREHLTTKLRRHSPDRIEVDCRTTYCRIAAEGRTNDASMAFQEIAQAVATEPWADLRNGEGGGSGRGDSWKQEYFLYRR